MTSAAPQQDLGAAVPESIDRTVCPSGLRVVTESMPGARSVCIGFYAAVGSRDEPESLAGASHFLEHLLFKGTASRTAREIATAIDRVGGEMNAFTSRELTAYYARLPEAHLDMGLELLSDVVAAPAFRPHEVDAEREVILDEIHMSDDDPDDVVHAALLEAMFPGHPLGRETLGTLDSVSAISRDDVAAFHAERYRPSTLVVAAAGALDHGDVLERVNGCLASAGAGPAFARTAPQEAPEALRVMQRPTEQVHLAMGWRGLNAFDDDRYALAVANQILGGGMASRLFQEVREERGLAYSIYSSPALYADAGGFTIGTGTAPARLAELLVVIDEVIEEFLADGPTSDEHEVAVGFLSGSTELGLEDSGSRMARLGGNEVVRGEVISVDEQLARLHAVEPDDVLRVARRVLDAPRTVSALGPFGADEASLVTAAGWRR